MNEDPDDRRSKSDSMVLWLIGLPIGLYGMGYFFARATHKLVRYSDTMIAGPHALSGGGFGFTWWELVFWPLTTLEEFVRQLF